MPDTSDNTGITISDLTADIVHHLQELTNCFQKFGELLAQKLTLKNGVENCRFSTCFPPVGGVRAHTHAGTREGLPKKARRLIPLPTSKTVSDHLTRKNTTSAILFGNENEQLTTSDHLSCENTPAIEEEIPVNKRRGLVSAVAVGKSKRVKKVKSKKAKPDPSEYDVPTSVKPIWNYWVALGLHVTGPETKTFKKDVRAVQTVLRGSFFKDYAPEKNRAYTCNEIKQAISRFAQAATNPDYEPARKSHLFRLTLNTFFWNAYGRTVHSYFLKFTEEKPKLLRSNIEPLNDPNPTLTNALIRKHYRTTPDDLTTNTKNQFISAAAKLKDFYDTVYLRNISMSPEPIGQVIDYLFECLANTFGHASVKPANYASDWTYNQCLPEYLSNIAAWDVGLEEDD